MATGLLLLAATAVLLHPSASPFRPAQQRSAALPRAGSSADFAPRHRTATTAARHRTIFLVDVEPPPETEAPEAEADTTPEADAAEEAPKKKLRIPAIAWVLPLVIAESSVGEQKWLEITQPVRDLSIGGFRPFGVLLEGLFAPIVRVESFPVDDIGVATRPDIEGTSGLAILLAYGVLSTAYGVWRDRQEPPPPT